jgi:hypothetical protein
VDSKENGEVKTTALYIATNTRVKGGVVEKSEKVGKMRFQGGKPRDDGGKAVGGVTANTGKTRGSELRNRLSERATHLDLPQVNGII